MTNRPMPGGGLTPRSPFLSGAAGLAANCMALPNSPSRRADILRNALKLNPTSGGWVKGKLHAPLKAVAAGTGKYDRFGQLTTHREFPRQSSTTPESAEVLDFHSGSLHDLCRMVEFHNAGLCDRETFQRMVLTAAEYLALGYEGYVHVGFGVVDYSGIYAHAELTVNTQPQLNTPGNWLANTPTTFETPFACATHTRLIQRPA